MKKILCILVTILSTATSDSSHSASSNSDEWHENACDVGNYDVAEYYEEPLDQWDYDDGWEQGYEEESWWSLDFKFSTGLPKISISCFMHGDNGCQTKCNLQCTLYDCKPRTSCCDDDFHCNCDEVYEFGSDQLTQSDFEFLDFNDLWSKTFETSIFSADIRKLIRTDKRLETYILSLLRNPHVSGDDIKCILEDKYPDWGDLYFLKSIKHIVKNKLLGAGKPLQYNDLNDHIDELYDLMETQPLDNVAKVKYTYRRRLRKCLQNITNIDDLEELLHLIKLSGDKKLYQLIKSILKNIGYAFEEDGEKPGKKGILRDLSGELADADEDEIMDLATLSKFMSQSSAIVDEDIKGPSGVDKQYLSGEISSTKMTSNQQPDIMVSDLKYQQNAVSPPPLSVVNSNNAPGSSNGQIVPVMPVLSNSENTSYFSQIPALENASLITAVNSNIQNLPLAGTFLPANPQIISSYSNNGQAIPTSGALKNDLGHRLYYIVVDEKGKVSDAKMVPKIPFMTPGNVAISPPPQGISSSQEMTLSNNSQANTLSWYGPSPYPFGYTPYTFGSPPPYPQKPPSSFPMGLPPPYMHGFPHPYPFVGYPPFAHEAPPPCPPQIQGEGGKKDGGGGVGVSGNRGRGGGSWSMFNYNNNNN